jgi:hypothetical protein
MRLFDQHQQSTRIELPGLVHGIVKIIKIKLWINIITVVSIATFLFPLALFLLSSSLSVRYRCWRWRPESNDSSSNVVAISACCQARHWLLQRPTPRKGKNSPLVSPSSSSCRRSSFVVRLLTGTLRNSQFTCVVKLTSPSVIEDFGHELASTPIDSFNSVPLLIALRLVDTGIRSD